eukprot:6481494-Amphidinium_carterae.1
MSRGKGVSVNDVQRPAILNMLHELGKTTPPWFCYTSVQLNELRAGEQVKSHVDVKNEGESFVISWGVYEGGSLQVLSDDAWQDRETCCVWTKLGEGVSHRVTRVTSGVRYSAVFYKPCGHAQCLRGKIGDKLRENGYSRCESESVLDEVDGRACSDASCSAQLAVQHPSEANLMHDSGGPKEKTKTDESEEDEKKENEAHREINEATCGPLLSACI